MNVMPAKAGIHFFGFMDACLHRHDAPHRFSRMPFPFHPRLLLKMLARRAGRILHALRRKRARFKLEELAPVGKMLIPRDVEMDAAPAVDSRFLIHTRPSYLERHTINANFVPGVTSN
jgi:hypothetical protein